MSFGRHRQKTPPQTTKEVLIIAQEETPLPAKVEAKSVVNTEVKEITEVEREMIPEPIVVKEIKAPVKEEIKKVQPKKRKKRVDKKEYTNIGIIGDTVVCRDFRAIVKKKGGQINTVLSEILHKWNTENYNL